MLRELITWVLNTYLGKYLEDFNPAQLSVALLSGEVELENVPLRKDALHGLGLPLQVISGTLGKIKLQVPVRQFRSAPWCIIIEKVYIVIGPKNLNDDEWNDEKERQYELDYKLSQLDDLEAKWRAQNESKYNLENNSSYYATSYLGWLNYGTGLVTNIIENLQLKINDVHIRYEDSLTINNYGIACGIKIDSLSAQSCDSNWLPGFTSAWNNQNQISFKLVELCSFSLYWDRLNHNESLIGVPPNELAQVMQSVINSKGHHFIINPITAQAHFKHDRSETPLKTRSRPRLSCEVIVNEIHLSLSDFQYTQLIECTRGLDEISRKHRYRLLRPQCSVKENSKLWWKYAAKCHGYIFESYEQKLHKAHENIKYMRIYIKLVQNPSENLSPDDKQFKIDFEMKRNLDELREIREICLTQATYTSSNLKEKTNENGEEANQGRSMLFHWFPQWWGWYGNSNNNNGSGGSTPPTPTATIITSPNTSESMINNEEISLEDEILNALEDTVTIDNSFIKRDVVFGKFDFLLRSGLLNICSEESPSSSSSSSTIAHKVRVKTMLEMHFDELKLNIETRPRSSSHLIDLSLGSVCVKDLITQNTEFPNLIKPQIKEENTTTLSMGNLSSVRYHSKLMKNNQTNLLNTTTTSSTPPPPPTTTKNENNTTNSSSTISEPWFQLQYEKKPIAYNTDYRLVIKTKSLDVVYNVGPLKWLIDFVTKPVQIDTAKSKLEAMKLNTKMKLIKNWKYILDGDLSQRKSWSLEIDVSAPQIIFVENFSSKNTTIVLVDFGRFQLLKNATQNCIRQQHSQQKDKDTTISSIKNNNSSSIGKVNSNSNLDSLVSPSTGSSNTLFLSHRDSEDEEAFMTPCSTPPGSQISVSDSPTLRSTLTDPLNVVNDSNIIINNDTGLENAFHDKIYDKYTIDLTDLQVIVCKGKERWSWASSKGTSALHVLDRFNISLHLERRVVNTTDPDYPSLTLYGTLPKLVAHINENKIAAITDMLNIISINDDNSKPSQNIVQEETTTTQNQQNKIDKENIENDENLSNREQLILLQFVIDQMSLELQSRGRSIAELQVSGVRTSLTKRPLETNISLSVHGLLLADAMQSFGQDFELLVASHRHVGMDSVSGSLRQSEPCSPLSPASPDPALDKRPTSPTTISKAISSLQKANSASWSNLDDLDALITVDISFITPDDGSEKLQIANIHFNNLDIIANQETIVELLSFVNRIFPSSNKKYQNQTTKSTNYESQQDQQQTHQQQKTSNINQNDSIGGRNQNSNTIFEQKTTNIKTQITFDFNRLNVLVLRALMRDSFLVGRKVGTFTMCEAKIHATIDSNIEVEGSLGGLQILDLTPEGVNHQRILSVGKDPLTEPPDIESISIGKSGVTGGGGGGGSHSSSYHDDLLNSLTQEVYGTSRLKDNDSNFSNKYDLNNDCDYRRALSFKVTRNVQALVSIKIRMASVWYTHCARFVQELSWCATEFKHYLKNIARSIRDKATDMAFGLVQPFDEDTSLVSDEQNIKPTLKYFTLKKRKIGAKKAVVKLDIILNTPVLVMPRSSCSSQVLVTHLGKISITNRQHKQHKLQKSPSKNLQSQTSVDEYEIFSIDEEDTSMSSEQQQQRSTIDNSYDCTTRDCDIYSIDVRNMNLFSLDTSSRKGFRLSALPRAEEFYSCQNDAVAILHDTAIRLDITKFKEEFDTTFDEENTLHIHGIVTQPLQISLTRVQYEQLLDTVDNIFKIPNDLVRPPSEVVSLIDHHAHHQFVVDDNSASPFNLGANQIPIKTETSIKDNDHRNHRSNNLEPKVSFTLPMFIIQLKNEHNNPHIEITFREFSFNYEKNNIYETHIQISLQSILMEDLLCPMDSKYRQMVVSSPQDSSASGYCRSNGTNGYSSNSCPDLVRLQSNNEPISGSLPENLESRAGFEKIPPSQNMNYTSNFQPSRLNLHTPLCPDTPPPSPQPKLREDNLVIYSSLIIDPDCPGLGAQYKGLRQTSSIDFNSLDLIISVERWYLLLNFFGLMTEEDADDNYKKESGHEVTTVKDQTNGDSELEITVRSLTLVLVRNESELAKANVSNAFFVVSKHDISKVIEGRLGSVSLLDLTPFGGIYREKFLTSGSEALNFIYKRDNEKNNQRTLSKDAKLKLQMSSVKYVHTKRFIMEIQMFIKEFLQLQTPVMRKIKSFDHQRPTQLGLEISADSPIILLPLSYNSNQVIVVDLGEFSLKNSFHLASEPEIISKKSDASLLDEILDVMQVDLVNTNFLTGERCSKFTEEDILLMNQNFIGFDEIYLDMGSYWIKRIGKNLLKDNCYLKLQIERNMDSWKSHNCPDFSVQGTLSKLEGVLNIEQYKLIRGFLSYNLGEQIDDVYNSNSFSLAESRINLLNPIENERIPDKLIWNMMSINLVLENVSLIFNWSTSSLIIANENPNNNFNENFTDNNCDYDQELKDSLACINFIKSCLRIDSFSDGSQDIDLVSQEILITDSRYQYQSDLIPPKNVFTNILQPIHVGNEDKNLVQAEIHSRTRNDHSKFTILLNNMRLMAIIDWIEDIQDFLSQNTEPPTSLNETSSGSGGGVFASSLMKSHGNAELSNSTVTLVNVDAAGTSDEKTTPPMEIILNITDSELVFVEKTDQLDTNAIILKSTTVVSFKQTEQTRPISINLNHLEVFSCILGSEEETALSIIDPITINLDVKDHTLQIQIQRQFCIRLSYHDVKMFTRMLQSLPQQTRTAQKSFTTATDQSSSSSSSFDCSVPSVKKLTTLGFKTSDCVRALRLCNNQLDEAALWLTQNREPIRYPTATVTSENRNSSTLEIHAIEIRAQCISISVIDDCKDADVPLLELSLSQVDFKQELNKNLFSSQPTCYGTNGLNNGGGGGGSGFYTGHLKAILASDYYNRNLSGWEPIIEPWECFSNWNYSFGQTNDERSRLNLSISSDKLLNMNITSTLVELWKIVQSNWTQDYYEGSNINNTNANVQSPTGYRRRTPFVPFSLKNNTGEDLMFKIFLTKPGGITRTEVSRGDLGSKWIHVKPNEVVPFSFGQQNKFRHLDSHKLNLHQVLVHVNGWSQVGPVSVDKVGIFFRHTHRESKQFPNMPKTRIVFAVTLEGSAQKLVTVRSALRLVNQLDNSLLLKMIHPTNYLGISQWPEGKTVIVSAKECYSVPLSHADSYLSFKPLLSSDEPDNLIKSLENGNNSTDVSRLNGNDYWQKYEMTKRLITRTNDKFYHFCDKPFHWRDSIDTNANGSGGDIYQEQRTCRGYGDKFYNVVVSIHKDGYPQKESVYMPGHTITLVPPLRITNLLCCDLLYRLLLHDNNHGRIQPSETLKIHEVNLDEPIKLNFNLDGYKEPGRLIVPARHSGAVELKLRLTDTRNRELLLRASIQSLEGSGTQILISAPYWLVNKTGLPLVFRQEGVAHEASGQFEEHEKARVVSPLMFSFSDPDASPALEVRLGNRFGPNPPWCQSLSMHKEIANRQLRSGISNETFVIGVEIRRGRGRYSRTSVVTFSPRFQLYNRSSHKLQFAQKCFVMKPLDSEARATIIDAVSGCHFPFHWPRSDHEPLLCVRIADFEGCCWSSGIPINEVQSLYINIRNDCGEMRFLRLEVTLQGATYFLLFGDAHALPPPIRIDNHSEVPIKFFQYEHIPEWRTTIKPHSSVSYSLDDPFGRQYLQIEAPDGDSFICNLRDLSTSHILTYSNFIYIAFKGTFQSPSIPDSLHMTSEFDIEAQHLVLGVKDKRVILMRKCAGDRSQLWLMNPMQQLEHEGSSAPMDPRRKISSQFNPRLVLDLEKAPNPIDFTNLVVRPANKQRESTQTWKFVDDRLMCGHANMCVQARDGIFGLRPGSDAVLGRIDTGSHIRSNKFVPIEQQIERQKLRPGSGQLQVHIEMDGPIKTIQIRDVNSPSTIPLAPDPLWKHASHKITSSLQEGYNFVGNKQTGFVDEYCIKLNLSGLGISVISKYPCEELAYATLEKISLEVVTTPFIRSIDLNINDMQIDNQLLETPCPILLYMPKITNSTSSDLSPPNAAALTFNLRMLPSPNANAVIFERLILSLRPFVLYLEERLILRTASFFELGASQQHPTSLVDESEYEAQQVTTKILAVNAKRYYFENLLLNACQIRLSVITASKLSPQLNALKKRLGLTMIRFEDAVIDFDRFADKHHFETLEVYLRAIKSHYKKQLKWHFGHILGSLDVFGNPLGLAFDVTEGVTDFILEGSVKSLVANVTHGFSNTAAKITETLSDGLGKVVLDEQDNEARQKILEISTTGGSTSKEHMAAAFKGLGFGILGGFTSIAKHTYEGTQSDGFQGFISGLGKGIVGTVTKPIIGMLDFASESANALREKSKSAHRLLPERKRLPRCISGSPGGLLPPYSFTQAKGQQLLYMINKRDFSEQLMSYEPNLCEGQNSRFRLLVSTEYVRILSRTEDGETSIILVFHLREVLSCHPVTANKSHDNHKLKRPLHYIEISSTSPNQLKRPRVRCQSEEMAEKASRHINYAKSTYDEREHTLNYDPLLDNT